MSNNWKIEEIDFQIISDKTRKLTIRDNGTDLVEAKFEGWVDQNTPSIIKIISSSNGGKYIHANYCKKLDRIEIHYILNLPFQSEVSLTIEKSNICVLECTEIVFVSYEDEDEAKKLVKCKRTKLGQPGHSKGSIIVSNP